MLIFFLTLIFLLQGLGAPYSLEIVQYLLIISPFLLTLFYKENYFKVPKTFGILSILFILFTIISTTKSIDMSNSINKIFIYPSLFFITAYVLNIKMDWEKIIVRLINFFSTFFVGLSYLLLIFPKLKIPFVSSIAGYNLLYSPKNLHNNLGDFLLIVIIVNFYYLITKKTNKINWVIVAFCLPLFILSFSRSAFLVLIIILILSLILYRRQIKKSIIHKIFVAIFHLLLFIFFSVVNRFQFLWSISNFLKLNKDTFGERGSYFISAIRSIIDFPHWGIGLGNFSFASFRYNDTLFWWTRTAHNIFLEVFTETGIWAGMCFLIILLSPFKKPIKNIFTFLYIVLLLNFQTYYTYQIYGILILFFILLGLLIEEKSSFKINKKTLIIIAMVPVLYIQLLVISNTLIYRGNYRLANVFNPFNKELYPLIINDISINSDFVENVYYRKLYEKVAYADFYALHYLSSKSIKDLEPAQALYRLERSFLWNPFYGDINLELKKIYPLMVKVRGKKVANKYINDYKNRLYKMEKNSEYVPKNGILNSLNQFLSENNLLK